MGSVGLIIQINLNRSARAQDLLLQALAERAVVGEPNGVPDHPHWIGDLSAADWGGTAVVVIYAPPSWLLKAFEKCLDAVPLVLGDFNAEATAPGSPGTDSRGLVV
ncbi:uncharacterized protein LOC144477518 [Augochlora pura]